MEEWKDINGFENYQISNTGIVKNKSTDRILSQWVSSNDYLMISLNRNNKRYNFLIHRLVAEHFLNEPSIELQEAAKYTKHKKVIVNHKDGIKTNNHINNLEWATYSTNKKHAHDNGLEKSRKGSSNAFSKLTEEQVVEIRKSIGTYKELSIKYNVSRSTISDIINRKSWKHI